MLAELAAINAAYGVIKEVVGSGRELYDCGAQLSSFFNNKATLQKKVNETPIDQRGQLEEFFALEKIAQQEEELKQIMIYTGRAGLWEDWLNFQAQAARARREEIEKIERQAYERRQTLIRATEIFTIALVVLVTTALIVAGIVVVVQAF
jgi:hypothetical protein